MDDRDQPDSDGVRLRRSGDPGEDERQRLASTIFAEEDDVGTFSRGNLVPPKQSAGRDEEAPAAPDPFFDELQSERSVSSVSTDAKPVASESTARLVGPADLPHELPYATAVSVALPEPGGPRS